MRTRLTLLFALLAALLGAGSDASAKGGSRYIVVLRDGSALDSVLRAHDRLPGTEVLFRYGALNAYAAALGPKALAAVRRDRRVRFVSPDRSVRIAAQQTPTGVRRIGAAAPPGPLPLNARALGVGVAVLDTGIDLKHYDLSPVVPAANCLSRLPPDDDNGHGTHVAGIIAARDNGVGVVGVAPGATLYAVKVLNSTGFGAWSQIICGIDWVTEHARTIRVVNMSLVGVGSATPSNADCTNANADALHYAICRSVKAGITYVVAAGNDSKDASTAVPAAYDEVITVSALSDSDGAPGGLGAAPTCLAGQQDDRFATFSNFGPAVDIAAPGVCIYSTVRLGWNVMSGTSMAAPHVAGAALLYLESNPGASPAEVRSAILAAAEAGPIAGDPDAFHEGVAHVGAAWTPALPPLPPIPPLPPVPPLPPLPPLPPGIGP